MTDGLLTIGAFSRASQVSVKQLRAYHEMGLLVPVDVDPATGYRRYAVDQLTEAAVIVRLRALDVPLASVREVLEARDPEHTRLVLARHRSALEQRLGEVERIVAALQEGPVASINTPVHLRDEKATATFSVHGVVTEADFTVWLGQAFEQLGAAVENAGVVPTGPAGALYPPEIDDEGPQPVEAYTPVPHEAVLPDRSRVGGVGVRPQRCGSTTS